MKTLKLNFTHPFIGHARINDLGESPICKCFSLNSNGSNLIEIPLFGFKKGSYKMMLDWEYGNQVYVHQHEFEIESQDTIIND